MEADLDQHWLSGEPRWWPRVEGQPKSKWVSIEIEPDESWNGWRRQRLRPMAARFLFAPAWSLAMLVASSFPILLPGNTPNDQTVASILFFGAFALLLIQPFRIASAMPDGDGVAMLKWLWFGDGFSNYSKSIGFTILGGVAFVGHIVIDVRIGWIAYISSLILWFHFTFRAGTALMPPSGRWLIPLGKIQFNGSRVSDEWVVDRKRFFPGRLAFSHLSGDRRVELHGVKRGGEKFMALHLRHPSSLLYDPFVDTEKIGVLQCYGLGYCGLRLEGVLEVLTEPPIALPATEWPEKFLNIDEEE